MFAKTRDERTGSPEPGFNQAEAEQQEQPRKQCENVRRVDPTEIPSSPATFPTMQHHKQCKEGEPGSHTFRPPHWQGRSPGIWHSWPGHIARGWFPWGSSVSSGSAGPGCTSSLSWFIGLCAQLQDVQQGTAENIFHQGHPVYTPNIQARKAGVGYKNTACLMKAELHEAREQPTRRCVPMSTQQCPSQISPKFPLFLETQLRRHPRRSLFQLLSLPQLSRPAHCHLLFSLSH